MSGQLKIIPGSPAIGQPVSVQILFAQWKSADQAWMLEISEAFPRKWPGDVRYTTAAHGEPGSRLRVSYDAYVVARDAARKAAGWL